MPPAETVEYIHSNLNDAQKAWCAKYESDSETNQVRVERFNQDGSAVVHLHGEGGNVKIATLASDGSGVSRDEEHNDGGGY